MPIGTLLLLFYCYFTVIKICTQYLIQPQDFAAAAHIWTETLCKTDSDGDGKTNGEELGDPACIWNVGDRPAGSAPGHPGMSSM